MLDYLGHLFDLPPEQQSEVRLRMKAEPDLPAKLAALLSHQDPQVRATCLALIRDDYGDLAVVSGVQELLAREMLKPGGGDAAVIASCCQILSEWPQWDSIPVLIDTLKNEPASAPVKLALLARSPSDRLPWRQADLALRQITGHWPLPEPTPPGAADEQPASDAAQQAQLLELRKTWDGWWNDVSLARNMLPILRLELVWYAPLRPVDAARGVRQRAATACTLWVRPTSFTQRCRISGLAESVDDPVWRWEQRGRAVHEIPLNAFQCDAVQLVRERLAKAAAANALWIVPRPPSVSGTWHGRVQITDADGHRLSVELVEARTPGATRPPDDVAEALAELLSLIDAP
ncbi:MAG: hypothetical protein BIFFINMI_01273 [Phycisphaerae bacterium]|nr:hypothetical protein [Phycisphaerae bacterium]